MVKQDQPGAHTDDFKEQPEEELQGHVNNVIRGVNNVDALSVPTLTNSPDTTEDAKRGLLNAFHGMFLLYAIYKT
jgi:hypothetical protein